MASETMDFTAMDQGTADGGAEPIESAQPVSSEEFQPTDQESQQPVPVDGRKVPVNYRNAAKAASEALPEQAEAFKEMANNSYILKAHQQHFKTPQEAASAKQLLDGIGGIEGATQLQARTQAFDAQDAALKDGNPEILDAMFRDFPDGAKALAPHYLDRLSRLDPQAFSAAIAPHALGMLESAGVGQHLQAILNETDPQRAKGLVQQLADWYKTQAGNIKQFQPQKAPGSDKIAEQQKAIDEQREALFTEGVSSKVTSAVNPEISKAVDNFAKQYKLNDTQKTHFQTTLQNKLVAELNADPTYKQQVDLRKANKARTHDTVASYISAEFNRRIPATALAVAKEIYGAPRGTQQPQGNGIVKAGTPQTAPGGGPLKVSVKPAMHEFADYPELAMDIIQGRGKMRNGRYVTWR